MIEHIPSGERHYFHRIEDLPKLILPYLSETETNFSPRKSLWQRLIPYRKTTLENKSNIPHNNPNRSSINSWLSRLQEWWRRQ
jgi:hypothetical protein